MATAVEWTVVTLIAADGGLALPEPSPLLETTPGRTVPDATMPDATVPAAPDSDVPVDVPVDAPPPLEQVYRDHALRVYRCCLSQVGNASDAEDLAAEVVLPWLLRIARNEVIDHRRWRTRRSAVLIRFFGGTSELDRSADVEGEVVVRDELRRVVAAMTRLSDRDRTLIGLRLAAGLPYAEIGAVLRVSEHAATVATKRALQRLRRHLEVPR